jgi:hypothetical protein
MCISLYGVSIRSVGRLSPTSSGNIRLVASVQVFTPQLLPRGVRTHGKWKAAQTQSVIKYRQTGELVPVVVHAADFFTATYPPRRVSQVLTADGTSPGGSPPWVHVKSLVRGVSSCGMSLAAWRICLTPLRKHKEMILETFN